MLNQGWRILDFNFPDQTPYTIFMEYRKEPDAEIYVTIVGDTTSKGIYCKSKNIITTHKVVDDDDYLRWLCNIVATESNGADIVLWQPVPKAPTVPTKFKICRPYACALACNVASISVTNKEREENRCSYEDDGYCLATRKCKYKVIKPELSLLD